MRTLMALAAFSLSPVVTLAQGRGADEAAIRARVTSLQNAINKRDAAAVGTQYTTDADVMIVDGSLAAGRPAIQAAFQRDWGSAPGARRVSIAVTGIRFLTPDIALINTLAQISEGPVKEDRGTWVLRKQGGAWLITALRVLPAEHR